MIFLTYLSHFSTPIYYKICSLSKVYVFYEGHKNWQKYLPAIWHYVVSVKLTVKILSIFVVFLENTNFNPEKIKLK